MSGWLDLRRQADQPERHRRDERDAGRQAVEAVDPVDAVDHPDDPEDRERRPRTGPAVKRIGAAAERVGDEVDADPERDRAAGQRDLAEQLPARAQVEQVVDGAEPGRDRPAEEQRRRPPIGAKAERHRHEVARSG